MEDSSIDDFLMEDNSEDDDDDDDDVILILMMILAAFAAVISTTNHYPQQFYTSFVLLHEEMSIIAASAKTTEEMEQIRIHRQMLESNNKDELAFMKKSIAMQKHLNDVMRDMHQNFSSFVARRNEAAKQRKRSFLAAAKQRKRSFLAAAKQRKRDSLRGYYMKRIKESNAALRRAEKDLQMSPGFKEEILKSLRKDRAEYLKKLTQLKY
eukprot:scaffold319_cov97-Cylindrotheca_fusiformis.AAC.11